MDIIRVSVLGSRREPQNSPQPSALFLDMFANNPSNHGRAPFPGQIVEFIFPPRKSTKNNHPIPLPPHKPE